jgi:very-short-patch-repair endonuclease
MLFENYEAITVIAVVICAILLIGNGGFFSSYKPKRYLNTKAEQNFLNQLYRVMPEYYFVYCKVRLADIIDVKNKRNIKAFNRISRKHIDFVICDKRTSKILACIELDDSSHLSRSAIKRDNIKNMSLKKAGVNLIRVKNSRSYSRSELLGVINSIKKSMNNE